ncbi:MAG: CoA transferase [Dethiosulfatibacter sp.]|nr:CoA transferase [Dethiosulfatibacter sp.]
MKPLLGIRIVDFTQAHAGSLATMLLADFGAEVIKIERAGVGDLARYWEPMIGDDSGYYAYLNRNKKSVAINAQEKEGKEIILNLIKNADVVCENFKFGSMEKMGFDYESIKKINPEVIYASLSGFGKTGEMKNANGLDINLQAMSGIMDRTGFPDKTPTRVGVALGDHLSGMYMATAVNLAIINKMNTGKGQKIDIAILDSLFSVLEEAQITYELTGKSLSRSGNRYLSLAPYDTLKAIDGYVTIAVTNEKQWRLFCDTFNLNEMYNNEHYKTNELRIKNYEQKLKPELEKTFASLSKHEIEKKLNEAGISSSAVKSVDEAINNEQIKDRDSIKEVNDKKLGKVMFPGIAIHMSETPGSIENTAPLMGEDTVYYLKMIGYTDDEVLALKDSGIIETNEVSKL